MIKLDAQGRYRDAKGRFASPGGNGRTKSNGNGKHRVDNADLLYNGLDLRSLLHNATSLRSDVLQSILDPRRDIDDECGYPKHPSVENYRQLYDRESIAAKVVSIIPKESWRVQPSVFETEDPEEATPFEEAWDNLARSLRGTSWYQDEEGNPIWELLRRADELSRIGSFGVIMLGFDDGLDTAMPVEGIEEENSAPVPVGKSKNGDGEETEFKFNPTFNAGIYSLNYSAVRPAPTINQEKDSEGEDTEGAQSKQESGKGDSKKTGGVETKRRLLFMRAFDESQIQITRYESNITSPRYGQPVSYRLTLNDYRDNSNYQSAIGQPSGSLEVHWTRVIHVADVYSNPSSNELFPPPAMRPVYNRLYDLRKLYGGSAEMYWRGAFPGVAVEGKTEQGDTELDLDDLRDQFENWGNGLQRWLAITGAGIKMLSPTVVDPAAQIDKQVEAICVQLDIPKRIFMGSERGELASGQDAKAWADRMRARQIYYITPRIIIVFVDRLIMVGALPEPSKGKDAKGGYSINWPVMFSDTDAEKAEVTVKRTDAMTKYIAGQVEALMAPLDYLTRELGYEESEAIQILENALEKIEEDKELALEEEEEDLERQAELRSEGLLPPRPDEMAEEGEQVAPGTQAQESEEEGEDKNEQTAPGTQSQVQKKGSDKDEEEEDKEETQNAEYNQAVENLARWLITLDEEDFDYLENVFCPTGKGGGIDPTCGGGKGGAAAGTGAPAGTKPSTWARAKQVATAAMKVANAAPVFASQVAREAGASERVAKAALVAATIGDFAIPGVPIASAAIVALSLAKKPSAAITVGKQLVKSLIESKVGEFAAGAAASLQAIEFIRSLRASSGEPTGNLDYLIRQLEISHNHLAGKHSQASHGRGGGGSGESDKSGSVKRLASTAKSGLAKSKITDDQRKEFAKSFNSVVNRMPPKARERMAQNVSKVEFHRSPQALTARIKGSSERAASRLKGQAAGAYDKKKGTLILDGKSRSYSIKGSYAHELTHAIDGKAGNKISDGKAWQSAFSSEMSRGQLSKYGATKASEGFAEFGRVLYSTKTPLSRVEKAFPKASAVFKENGLWPNR